MHTCTATLLNRHLWADHEQRQRDSQCYESRIFAVVGNIHKSGEPGHYWIRNVVERCPDEEEDRCSPVKSILDPVIRHQPLGIIEINRDIFA